VWPDGTATAALIKAWLQAPIVERDDRGRTRRSGGKRRHCGTPQGGVVSPLLALLYMRRFLLAWRRWEEQLHAYVYSYADDRATRTPREPKALDGGAAQEMGVGPPEPLCRERFQTTASCAG